MTVRDWYRLVYEGSSEARWDLGVSSEVGKAVQLDVSSHSIL